MTNENNASTIKLTKHQHEVLQRAAAYNDEIIVAWLKTRQPTIDILTQYGLLEFVNNHFGTARYAITDAGRAYLNPPAPSGWRDDYGIENVYGVQHGFERGDDADWLVTRRWVLDFIEAVDGPLPDVISDLVNGFEEMTDELVAVVRATLTPPTPDAAPALTTATFAEEVDVRANGVQTETPEDDDADFVPAPFAVGDKVRVKGGSGRVLTVTSIDGDEFAPYWVEEYNGDYTCFAAHELEPAAHDSAAEYSGSAVSDGDAPTVDAEDDDLITISVDDFDASIWSLTDQRDSLRAERDMLAAKVELLTERVHDARKCAAEIIATTQSTRDYGDDPMAHIRKYAEYINAPFIIPDDTPPAPLGGGAADAAIDLNDDGDIDMGSAAFEGRGAKANSPTNFHGTFERKPAETITIPVSALDAVLHEHEFDGAVAEFSDGILTSEVSRLAAENNALKDERDALSAKVAALTARLNVLDTGLSNIHQIAIDEQGEFALVADLYLPLNLEGYRVIKRLCEATWDTPPDDTPPAPVGGGADGDPVGEWQDRSSNARHLAQATARSKPTFKAPVDGDEHPTASSRVSPASPFAPPSVVPNATDALSALKAASPLRDATPTGKLDMPAPQALSAKVGAMADGLLDDTRKALGISKPAERWIAAKALKVGDEIKVGSGWLVVAGGKPVANRYPRYMVYADDRSVSNERLQRKQFETYENATFKTRKAA